VAGITAATSSHPSAAPAAGPTVRPGAPPLSLDLGVRVDREARDLREGMRLYAAGRHAAAEKLFARHDSLEARIGEAFSRWPDGSVARLTQLSGLHPKSAAVQLNLGIAQFWAGEGGAKAAWQSAAELEPDTAYAVTAGNLLHPDFARNLPVFVPSTKAPAAIRNLAPPAQFATLERRARTGTVADRLFYGVALQRLGRQLSAERVYAEAALSAPGDPEARVAAAVGLFAKAEPARAFSRLGPLTRTFPKAATVRFHLGLLLLWSGQVKEARRQLRLVRTVDPSSPLAGVAKRYLDELRRVGV
jgi:tetratricopeptide (TPR) repeat protein